MKQEQRNLEDELGPSPWPIYANEDEPWKDYERLLKLEEKFKYQYEIAHVLGTTPATISYWMQKAHDEYVPEVSDEDLKCEYFEVCHNETPHPNNSLCVGCIGLLRHNTSEHGDGIGGAEFKSMTEYVSHLYDHYDEVLY